MNISFFQIKFVNLIILYLDDSLDLGPDLGQIKSGRVATVTSHGTLSSLKKVMVRKKRWGEEEE